MRRLIFILLIILSVPLNAQDTSAFDGISLQYELQVSASNHKTPLWLNANKYGLSSLDKSNGYARVSMIRDSKLDSERKCGLGYGIDFAIPYNYATKVAIQQLFVEYRYKKMVFGVGSKYRPMALKNQTLSSGSQALGINARPVPQVYISADDYMSVPYTKDWISVKGHLAYGMMTDGKWQRDFTEGKSRWVNNTMYHSKAGYMKVGKSSRPFSVEVGLEIAVLFGGMVHWFEDPEHEEKFNGLNGFSSFWHAFIPGGRDHHEIELGYENIEGDHLGSWVIRLNYNHDCFNLSLYGDKFFEDHSGLYNLGFYGYGKDGDWEKRSRKLYLYPLKDGMLGLELSLKKQQYVKNILVEFMNTRFQSGPIYHDHTETIYDQIAGQDDNYNHSYYSGWQYYGQVIGNPLYLSPQYNDDGALVIGDNRFFAWHFGVDGEIMPTLSYRILGSWQKGYGTYSMPYSVPKENFSLLIESQYDFSKRIKGMQFRIGYGLDNGSILGNNHGLQFSLIYKYR